MTLVYSRVLSLFETSLVLNRTTIDLKDRCLLGAQEQSINLRLLRKPPLRQLGFVFAHKTFIIASILRRKCLGILSTLKVDLEFTDEIKK